jgi:CheY-like chemotaxis protein
MPEISEARFRDARLLIVDDEQANIKLIERILAPAGLPEPEDHHRPP